jgi:hypothetical protein
MIFFKICYLSFGVLFFLFFHVSFLTYKIEIDQALVAPAGNLSYSGGRDQEDLDSKPALAKSLRDPISKKKNPSQKGLMEWLKVWALSSNPSITKKKEGKKEKDSVPVFPRLLFVSLCCCDCGVICF